MKAIKICKENESIIAEAIAAAEGKATERKLTANYLIENIDHFNWIMAANHWAGTKATIGYGGTVAHAYKYTPMATKATVLAKSTGWCLIDVARLPMYCSDVYLIYLPDAAKAWYTDHIQDMMRK